MGIKTKLIKKQKQQKKIKMIGKKIHI